MINNGKFSNAALGSALYKFGWSFGGRVKSTQGGHFVVVIEFLSVPRQQADAGEIVQGERLRRQQVDQKIVIRHHSLV